MKAIILLALLAAPIAQAQQNSIFYTGQDLYLRFSSDRAGALAYIAGAADAQSGVSICIPPGQVTLGQVGDMVKLALERVPSERHLSADVYVQAVLEKRWPCAKKGQSL